MVRFTVLASGSKGNSTVVTGGRTRILVDAGLSCRELFRRMKLAGEDPETLDAVIITHEHTDHVNGLAVTARKLGIPVYFTEGTHRAWMRWLTPRRQMTYAQWIEQCRRQAAERQAEADAAQLDPASEPDESDGLEEPEAVLAPGIRPRKPAAPHPLPQRGPHLAPLRRVLPGRTALRNRRHRHQSLHHPPRRRRPRRLRLPHPGRPPRLRHRPRLHPPQRQSPAPAPRPFAPRVQPRPGDAPGRPLPLVSETKGTFARWSPLQRGRCRFP